MVECAVVGATGYTGAELIKIILRHPHARISCLTTRQEKPIPVGQVVPTLPAGIKLEIETFSFMKVRKNSDVIFLCLPHTESAITGEKFRKAGKIVIDLSADFRLRNAGEYDRWYGLKHPRPALLKDAVYGLPEFFRKDIQKADLIANPGCYPTGASLGILPLLKSKLIDPASIIIDSKSGVSGAGKKLVPSSQFCEVSGNFYAYKVGRHQHTPEINQTLSNIAGRKISVTFVPHLLPIDRGILSTIYLKRRTGVGAEEVRKAFEAAYLNEPFIRIKPDGSYPAIAGVAGTNYCDIGFWTDPESDRLVVVTAIDNLLKGASGQAVQNMNVRCEFPEEAGLKTW